MFESGTIRKYIIYAFGEIALVVLGILIALQINNWNEARINKLQEQRILLHIHEEFQLNRSKLDEVRGIMNRNQSACNKIISLVGSSKQELEENNLDSLIHFSTMYVGYNPTQNVLSDLLNSGRLQLITDEEIRNLLFEWSQVLLEMQEWHKAGDGWFQEHVLPYLSKHTSLRAISTYGSETPLPPSKLKVDPTFIFGDTKQMMHYYTLKKPSF